MIPALSSVPSTDPNARHACRAWLTACPPLVPPEHASGHDKDEGRAEDARSGEVHRTTVAPFGETGQDGPAELRREERRGADVLLAGFADDDAPVLRRAAIEVAGSGPTAR